MAVFDVKLKGGYEIMTPCKNCGDLINIKNNPCCIILYESDERNPMSSDLMFKCVCKDCYNAEKQTIADFAMIEEL